MGRHEKGTSSPPDYPVFRGQSSNARKERKSELTVALTEVAKVLTESSSSKEQSQVMCNKFGFMCSCT